MRSLTRIRLGLPGAALATGALLAGCATVYEGGYQRAEGWRRGGVVSVHQGTELERPNYWACTRDLAPEQRANKRYVVVWFVEGKYKGYYAAEAPPGREYARNDPVFVNVMRCQDALVARAGRM